MKRFWCQFVDEHAIVVIESDSRSFYAYFLEGEQITGSVWLFNVRQTPTEPEWGTGVEGPYMNHRDAAIDLPGADLISEDDFQVFLNPKSESHARVIYLKGILIAKIWPGSNPGKSLFARLDTPLALRLDLTSGQRATAFRKLGVPIS
jgi:hypothetical protein